MTYQPVTEEDSRWATTEADQQLYSAPCGSLWVWVDRISNLNNEQPITRNVLLFGIILLGMFMLNLLLDDEHIAVLTSGAKVCADKADFLEKVNHRCQVRNKFATAFLNGAPWVKCASFTRGATLLAASADSNGVRWYDIDDKNKVPCKPWHVPACFRGAQSGCAPPLKRRGTMPAQGSLPEVGGDAGREANCFDSE